MYYFLSPLILLVLWSLGSMALSPLFLPSPLSVLASLRDMMMTGLIVEAWYQSFIRITVATMLSVVVSIPIGLMMSGYSTVNRALSPFVSFMRYLPATAFYPLLIMWIGIGEEMRIAFLFSATVFYFLPSVVLAIQEVGRDTIEGAMALGFSRFQTLAFVTLPAALPSILESFLMMYGIGWTYIIIAEIVNTNNGLGHLINIASARGKTDMVFAALLVIIVSSVVFDLVSKKFIRSKFQWKYMNSI